MKQRYNELTEDLIFQAVKDCFAKKWERNDVSSTVEEYAGIRRQDISREIGENKNYLKQQAIINIGYEVENRLKRLLNGNTNALELDPVVFHNRKDGMNGKVRKIAYCCIFHQIFNHVAYLGLKPLLNAKILPSQFASIPKRGQTGLKKFVTKKLRKKKYNIRHARKTDVKHAYETTKYAKIIAIIRKEIPSARWIILLLEELAKMSPEGCLIIGGYLDAWLFNFLMSYVLRHARNQNKLKRGKKTPLIKEVASFMDDFGFMGSRAADIAKDIKIVNRYLANAMSLSLKYGKTTDFLSIKEEKAKRKELKPSKRACPFLDIGGYRMHASHVTIRGAIFIRLRRAYLRANKEVEQNGSMSIQRAYKIVAYFGYVKNSDSRGVRKKYNVDMLHSIAKSVVSNYQRKINKRRLIK
ncbi:MAG: reverse transcriptase domain-containing protein [Christensenellaceae bacterium]